LSNVVGYIGILAENLIIGN